MYNKNEIENILSCTGCHDLKQNHFSVHPKNFVPIIFYLKHVKKQTFERIHTILLIT